MHNLVNFTLQLELLQNKIDYEEENLPTGLKINKFCINKESGLPDSKKYFDLVAAVQKVKIMKQRLVEIRKKKEFRELQRAQMARNLNSVMSRTSGYNTMSKFGRKSQQKWRGLLDASNRMSEIAAS